MIPAGTYEAVATDSQWGTTANDTKQVALAFRIISGAQEGNGITWFGYFTEKTYKRTMESLRYCGWRGNKLMELGQLDQKVKIVVGHEEYEGKTVAKVLWVNRFASGMVTLKNPMSPDELQTFSASLEEKAAEIPESVGESIESDDQSAKGSAEGIPF